MIGPRLFEIVQGGAKRDRDQRDAQDCFSPLEYMIRVMRDPKAKARRRDAMAAAAAPYVHHRLSSTEHSGPGDGPVQVVIQTGFVYDDARADAAVASKPK